VPELPEVETLRQELASRVIGKTISFVKVSAPRVIRGVCVAQFCRRLKGQRICAILRRGKLLIISLSKKTFLTVHLKMTGQMVYPGDGKKSRVSFYFTDQTLLDFNDQRLFGELRLFDNWESFDFVRSLGPEPLEISKTEFVDILAERKTKIKPLLMDQHIIAGIGNLYAAEALFDCRIHPERASNTISATKAAELLCSIKKILRKAIRCGGSSIDDYVRLPGEKGAFVCHHAVYGRKGKACPVCKGTIKRSVVGGRGTFFCPRCQK